MWVWKDVSDCQKSIPTSGQGRLRRRPAADQRTHRQDGRQELRPQANAAEYLKFYSNNGCSKSVSGQLTVHFKSPLDQGHIVFATHQVLPFIPFWPNKNQWYVLIDEELQVVKHNCFNLPKTHGLITDLIDLEPQDSIYSRIVVTDRSQLSEIARNKAEDDIYEWFRETAQLLINENWESFVNTEQFAKLKDNRAQQLSIHSILSPGILGGCKSATMTSANFADTLVYKLWRNMGVTFQEDDSEECAVRHSKNGSACVTSSNEYREHAPGHTKSPG